LRAAAVPSEAFVNFALVAVLRRTGVCVAAGFVVGAPSRGGDVKSKQLHKSPDGSPAANAGTFHGVSPKRRRQNLTRLACEKKS